MLASPEMEQVHRAYREGVSLMVRMGEQLIRYEPGLPASGMTLFGENGFVLGPEALESQAELIQTCLHELYRLTTSQIGRGAAISRSLVEAETQVPLDLPSGPTRLILEKHDARRWESLGGGG